jgi:hypothetical protein
VGPDPQCAVGGQTEFADACEAPEALLCVPSQNGDADDDLGDDDLGDDDLSDDDLGDDDLGDDDLSDDDLGDDDLGDDDLSEPVSCSDPMSIVVDGECTTCDDARAGEAAAFAALGERNELFACEQRSDCALVFAATPCAPHCSVSVATYSWALKISNLST